MAISYASMGVGDDGPVTTFTMSLMQGWDKIPAEQGGRPLAAGDLVLLAVRKPFEVLSGPPGWTLAASNVFYRVIGNPCAEQPPVFTARGATDWEIEGYAVAGDQVLDPIDQA